MDWSKFEPDRGDTEGVIKIDDWSAFVPDKPVEGGFVASVKSGMGSLIKGAGQAAGDFLPGVDQDNALKKYGQSVIEANPTAVHNLSDIADKPWTAVKEAAGNAGGSIGQMLGARAVGSGITMLSPWTGPAAPAVALLGQAVSWLGPAAIAALPSYGGIRDKQILNDPANNDAWKAKAVAALGAAAVGAIETKFGPQQWALGAMTKEGRAALAEKFAETTLAKGIGYGALKGAAIEGAEELVQNPIEQLAAGDDPTTKANLKDTAFSGVMGALGGGALGGGFGMAFREGKREQPKVTPADIVSPEVKSVDEAIAVTQAAIEAAKPAESTNPADLLGTQTQTPNQSFLGAARATQEQQQADAADLADLVQSETRNLQVMRAHGALEREKAAELDQIHSQSVETLGRLPDQQVAAAMAATDETPTAMQLAMQRALAAKAQPDQVVANLPQDQAEPAPALAETVVVQPRLVARTPDMVAMPQKLAEQRAAANPALEAVRIQNQNGKFAYTVIPKAADVSATASILPEPTGNSGRGAPQQSPTMAPGLGRGSDTGTSVVARSDGNLPSSQPVLSADQPSAVDQRLIELRKQLDTVEFGTQAHLDLLKAIHTAVEKDATKAIESGSMPVYAVGNGMHVALSPSAQNPGQFQITRYSPKGIMSDSQYSSIEQAVTQEGLSHKVRLDDKAAAEVIGKSAEAESQYQEKRPVDQRLIPVSQREASRENAAQAPQEARASTEPAAVPAAGDATLQAVTKEKPSVPQADQAQQATPQRQETPAADQRLIPVSKRTQQAEHAPSQQGEVVSTYNGKFGKGMNRDAARLEAQRLNRTSADKNVTYTAEEHNDPKLENPWTVVGRKIAQPAAQAAASIVAPASSPKRASPARGLRKAAYERNPLLTFLATHGLFHDKSKPNSLKSEFSPDKGIMVMGYGPVFRKTGKNLDELVAPAIEMGYLPHDGTESELYDLIRRAMAGEKIQPMYAEGVADAEFERQMQARQELEEDRNPAQNEAAPQEDVDPYDALSDDELLAMREAQGQVKALSDAEWVALDEDIPFEVNNNASTEDFLRAMGASDEEIQDAIAKESRVAQANSPSRASTQEAATSQAPGNSAQRGEEARSSAGELTSPTRADILAQQERTEQSAKDKEKADRAADKRAREEEDRKRIAKASEAAADSFELGGDAMANLTGQKDIFSQPEVSPAQQASAILDAAGVTGTERRESIKDVKAGNITVEELAKIHPARGAPKGEGVKADRINDFGEKIGGAKKDTWAGFKDDLTAIKDDDIASRKLSEIWPAPDYQKMIDDGMDAKSVAVIRALRDEIPAKPRTAYKVKRWAEQVKTMRDLAANILNERDTGAAVVAQLERGSSQMRGIAGRVDLYLAVGHEKSLEGIRLSRHHYSLYRGRENVSLWVAERDAGATAFSNWPQELATGDTKEDAIAAFKARYAELDGIASAKKASFDIYSQDGKFFIGKKIGRNMAEMAGPFATLKETREYRTSNLVALDAKLAKYKEIPQERRDTNEPRVGEDMRNGQDVTPEMFAQAFGFKGVEFGNWVEQKRRQKDLNDAFDSLMDMAAILEVPAKAMSLNGELGLAFGARGSGGVNPAAAHYEPGKVVINLTKREGAGSLGHEWWHALDNYFSRMRGSKTSPFMTTATDVGLSARKASYEAYPGVRREMVDAFGEVVRAIRNTSIKARSSKLDAKRTKEYWTTGEEMAARAFESYLISKLHDQNASNDYLANVVDEKTWEAMAALGMENEGSYPYPTAGEMPVIREGFDKFFQTLETKETDKGVAMFSRAAPDVSDPQTGVSVALLELGKNPDLYQYPKSDSKDIGTIAKAKGLKVSDVDRDSSDSKIWLIANTAPQDTATAKSWLVEISRPSADPRFAILTNDNGKVYINVSSVGEGNGGSAVYDLAANYAVNNGLTFIGDPLGVSPAAMRRRLENMLSAAVKYGTTDFMEPHADQLEGNPAIGVPALNWTKGDTLANIRSMVDVSVASTESTNPVASSNVHFDAATQSFRDGEDNRLDAQRLSEMLGFDGRTRGTGQAGNSTLRRNAIFRTLLSGVGARRALVDALHSEQNQPGAVLGDGTRESFYSRGERTNTGLTPTQFTTELAKAFGAKVADRLQAKGVVVPLADQSQLPAHVVPFLRDGDRVYGFYDPKTDRTYAVLENLTPDMVKGLTLHEVGVHYGFKAMLGDAKYANVMQRLDVMRRAGSKAVKEAYAEAKKNAVRESQVPEESLAYLVQTQPEMGLVKEIIARIKAFLFNEFGIGGKYLTEADLTMLARAAVDHSSRMEDGGGVVPAFMRGTTEPVTKSNDVVGNQGGRSADDTTPGDFAMAGVAVDGLTVRDEIPNQSSIGSSVDDYTVLPGVREIPLTAFTQLPKLKYYSVSEETRTKRLAEQIKDSGEINPLIVVIDKEGPYVLEGGHRFDALRELGKTSFPAMVVLDNDSLNEPTAPDSGGAMYSRSSIVGQTNPHSWNAPEPSKFDDLVYKLQDKHIDTKRVIDAIRETAGTLADEKDVYLQEELFHGRAAARTEDFVNKELGPLVTEMKMRGIDIQTLDEYLHARHAEEANELIAQRNPEIQDGGSGMTTKAARDYLAKLDPAERKRLEAVAAKVDAILAGTRQMYADYHLESDATVKGWGQMFKHYVPLMREDKDGGMGIGQGFSIKGKETKGRTGSTRKVVDILANIAMQRERAIVRGEKNRVSTALVGLVELNPSEEFWAVGPPPMEKVYDPKTDSVVERADPLYKSRENVIVAKIKQANGEIVEKAVRFNEDNERAMRMAAALKNLDAAQLNGVLGTSAKITRYFAAINTQYNPIFGTVNLVRDFQGALLNLSTTPLKNHKMEIAGHTLSALKGIYLDARAARDGKTPTSAWAGLWEEFQDEGGQTGYRDMFATSADRAKAIEHELNPTAWMDSPLGKVFTAGGALKVPLALAQKYATGLFSWLSDYNLAMENAVRLSAYKVGLEQGMSKQQAASLGKNLTVNFNRKGQVGQQAGAIYAFWNASMQGSARIGQTLFDMKGGDAKSIRLSATGKKIVYGGMLLGTMQALLLAAAGFDDEEPPDFVRERSLIIPTGGKSYVTIPMPLGLHVIPNMGRIPTEFVLGGFRQPAKHVLKLLGLTAGAFNPVGGGASLVQMLSPTAVDPLVALAENKDWTGKPIAKTSYDKATPGHALVKDTASGPAKLLAEAINTMTGGTKYTAGVFSPTPDQIDYLWGQATGGVGREIGKAQQTTSAALSGEDLPVHKIPLVGRFYGDADTQSAQSSKFYANINRLNEHEAEIKGLSKDKKVVELAKYKRENPDARLFERANLVEREVQKQRRIKREMVALGEPPERIKAVEARITQLMTGFNEQVARLKQAP